MKTREKVGFLLKIHAVFCKRSLLIKKKAPIEKIQQNAQIQSKDRWWKNVRKIGICRLVCQYRFSSVNEVFFPLF